MIQFAKKLIKPISITTLCIACLAFNPTTYAFPIPQLSTSVTMYNKNNLPIDIKIASVNGPDNYHGDFVVTDKASFPFSVSDDQEYYQFSYHNAVCKVPYDLFASHHNWDISVIFYNEDDTEKCAVY